MPTSDAYLNVLVNTLNATVLKDIAPLIYDQVMKHTPILYRFWRKGSKVAGGLALTWPILTGKKKYGGWYTGDMALAHGAEDLVRSAEIRWKHIYYDITIPYTDILKASGGYQKVDFIKSQVDQAIHSLRQDLSEALLGKVTSQSPLILDHLLQAIDAGGTSYSYNGYQVVGFSEYAGISHSETYWKANVLDKSASANVQLSEIQQMYIDCADGDEFPTLMVVTPKGYNLLWSTAQAAQRFVEDEEMVRIGFPAFKFNGATVILDKNLPDGTMLFINEKWVDLVSHQDDNFVIDPFTFSTSSQRVIQSRVCWTGNLKVNILKYHGKIVRATNL